MANTNQNYRDEASGFLVKSAILSNERLNGYTVNVTSVMSDLEIYESIDKPFLTGKCLFVDFNSVLDTIKFSGDEKLKITIQKPGQYEDIVKTFYIDSVITSARVNDSIETFIFHLVEDTDYLANLQNINKSYTGKPSEIIKNIISQYFPNKTFTPLIDLNLQNESNGTMKVIIPNLDPVESIMWIKKNCRTSEGMPYFLFTSLCGGDNIYFTDLGSLLKQVPINLINPFKNWQAGTQYDISTNEFQIANYKTNNQDNLYSLIKDAHVGASHNFYDTIKGNSHTFDLDIEKEINDLYRRGVLSKAQRNHMYPEDSKINNQKTSSYVSQKSFTYPVTKSYENGFETISAYNEELNENAYRRKVIGLALSSFLEKNQMTVTVPGTTFLQNDDNYTVGNVASFQFMQHREQNEEGRNRQIPIDNKKSGYYLITRTVHVFKPENYYINMDICKLQDIVTSEQDL